MTKKQHRAVGRRLARYCAKHIKMHLNILGFEMALMVNFGLTVSNETLQVMYGDYKKALAKRKA
jgi:hypothetical protein